MKTTQTRPGGVFDKEGSGALAAAAATAPGVGMAATPNSWCYKCNQMKPVKGGTNKNKLFKCAGCQPVKLTQ